MDELIALGSIVLLDQARGREVRFEHFFLSGGHFVKPVIRARIAMVMFGHWDGSKWLVNVDGSSSLSEGSKDLLSSLRNMFPPEGSEERYQRQCMRPGIRMYLKL